MLSENTLRKNFEANLSPRACGRDGSKHDQQKWPATSISHAGISNTSTSTTSSQQPAPKSEKLNLEPHLGGARKVKIFVNRAGAHAHRRYECEYHHS